jgi:predicted nucleic acid-binding protein
MANRRRAYIDACCFIDMVKTEVGKALATEREQDVWHLKRLLEANRDGEVELYTSVLTIAECSHAGDNDISEAVKSTFTRLLMSGQYVRLVQLTPFIAQDARDLRWNHGVNLGGADAIHLATALDRKCEEFLSADSRFQKINAHSGVLKRLGIEPRSGRATDCLPDKYRQLDLPDDSNGR